ncbi:hypothetical protein ACWEOZ_23210 [Actinoplanes sp. NPDC004185]
MADRTDILMQQWQSRWDQIRHSETQRAALTNMVLVLAAAGLGFIAQKGFRPSVLMVSGALILLGVFGALASAKFYERFRLHLREASEMRRKLDDSFPDLGLAESASNTWGSQVAEFPFLSKVPLYGIWILLHTGIAIIGLLVSIVILVRL